MEISRRSFLKATGATIAGTYLGLKYGLPDSFNLPSFFEDSTAQTGSPEIKTVHSTCWIGKQDCGMLCHTVNGRVVKLEGNPNHPRNVGTLCPKGTAQVQAFYDPNRVKKPMRRINAKGQPGVWEEIDWDTALQELAGKIETAQQEDPKYFIWQKGRSKAKSFYDKAFVHATGATKLHHGAFCSDAGYRALEYTLGTHGVLHPDLRHTKYLLSWGWNITNSGGNKLCWLTWPQQLVKAKERGLKLVQIDPRLRSAGHFADEWLPIKPGTDLALALALCNQLILNDTIDYDYLRQYTNAPYLIKEDGYFIKRDDGGEEKPLVWDPANNEAVFFDTEGIEPALEHPSGGEFNVDGNLVKPAFQLFKDHVSIYTPAEAEIITGLPAATISEVAVELGENAMIGSTIEVEGLTLPYRPVAIMAYHVAQQELGFQALRAMTMIPMLLGAVGAVGGQFSDFTWKIHKNYAGLNDLSLTEEPNLYLNKSKFYPINSNNSSLVATVLNDENRQANFGVDFDPAKAVVLLHMANPLGSFPDYQANFDVYSKFDYVAAIDPWLSKTADLFANLVLPAATIEKYEGPLSATDQYVDAKALRLPPMDPLFDSKGEIDIYLDLCEKLEVLYGDGGYLAEVNDQLKLEEPHTLDLNTKPAVREIFDKWAKTQGLSGIDFFEQNGVQHKGNVAATSYYGAANNYAGAVHRLYGESLLALQQQMKTMGAEEIYWRDYTPFPTWREPIFVNAPDEYNLYLISYKMVEFKQSRTPVALLRELSPETGLDINPQTAKGLGLNDGDEVTVESFNTVTKATRQVTTKVRYRRGIRDDTVAMPHHYGEHTHHPWMEKSGPTPNALFFSGKGYVTQTADQTYCVKVKVTPAGGGG